MYTKLNIEELRSELTNNGLTYNMIKIDSYEFICCNDGNIFRKMKSGNWKIIENKSNHKKGYNVILINKKQYSRAKLIMYSMGKLELSEKNKNIYHINKDKLDCSFTNLSLTI